MFLELLGTALFLGLVFFLHFFRCPPFRTYRMVNRLPGPQGYPLVGVALSFAFLKEYEILQYFKAKSLEFPRIMQFWVLGMPNVYVQKPEDIECLMGNVTNIRKGIEYYPLIPWLKEGLLISTGQKWHTRRKLLTPAFHFRILEDSLQTFNKCSRIFTEKLVQARQPIDVLDYAKKCTMDVICESVMGVPLDTQNNKGEEYLKAIHRICELVVRRELCFWLYRDWTFYLSPTGFEFRKVLSVLHTFTDDVIAKRRELFLQNRTTQNTQTGKTRKAFLDLMIEFEANNPGTLSHYDIREEVDTFMFEGHDTTSSTLTFILFCLGNNQDVQERVVQELFQIFGDSDRAVTMEDLSKMTYLEKVIKETMRLYPAVPYMSRLLTTDMKLNGDIVVPAETNVMMIPYHLHRDPKTFPDPECFDPERFCEEENAKRHPFAYIPFSAGPRNCIGQKYAMMELKTITANVLRGAHIEAVSTSDDLKLMPLLILKSHIPVLIKATVRKSLQ